MRVPVSLRTCTQHVGTTLKLNRAAYLSDLTSVLNFLFCYYLSILRFFE